MLSKTSQTQENKYCLWDISSLHVEALKVALEEVASKTEVIRCWKVYGEKTQTGQMTTRQEAQ